MSTVKRGGLRGGVLPLVVVMFVAAFQGLVAAQVTTRDYGYDSVSNRTSATQQIRFTSESAFSLFPPRAVPGDRVNIYGRNLDSAGTYTVDFAGVPGTVLTVAPRVITVTVPPAVGDGAVIVTLPDNSQIEVGTLSVQGVVVTPGIVDLDYGESFQFTADVFGASTPDVVWELEAIVTGATTGNISAAGLYTAPAAGAGAFPVLVKATNVELSQTAYALVRGDCASSTMIAYGELVRGDFSSGDERDCYDFSAEAGQVVTASYLGGSVVRRFRVLNDEGYPLATVGGGAQLSLPAVLIPAAGNYRLEVEGDSGASGAYQVFLDLLPDSGPGTWIFPGSGFWHDATRWSGGAVPSAGTTVVIPDYPADITVTLSQGSQSCASITSAEGLTLSGGSLTVSGTIQVSAPFALSGGTLHDATIIPGAGNETPTVTGSSTIAGVTFLGGGITIPSARSLFCQNGLFLAAGAVVSIGDGATGHAYLYFSGSQSITGSGQIVMNASPGGWSRYLSLQTNGTIVTIGPGVTVRGADGVLNANSTQGFINQGTVQSDVASEPFVCLYLDNQGMVDALNGSTLTLDGNWSNSGTIAMTNSTVNLDGNFTVTGLGAFNRTGGTVNLSGTLNLTSEVLTLDAASGSWNLVNGTVIGGTIVTADGANLTPSNSGTFDGVTISGEGITIPSTRSIVSHNGLTIDSGATLDLGDGANGHSYLYLSGSQTIDGDGEILMNASPGGWSRYLSLQTNGTMVTIGPGVTVRGADGVLNANSTQGFINQGTIQSDVASEPFVCLYLDNQGMVDALNGSTLTLDGNWSNAGTIAMTNSTVNLDGNFTVTGLGAFNRTGGTVNLSGTLNLASEVLTLDAASGSWNLVNGTVIGGTIVTADFANLTPSNSGTFDGVTVSGQGITIPSTRSIVSHNGLTIDSGATLDLGDGATGHSYLYLSGSQTIDGDGELLMNASPGGWSRYLSLQTNGTMVTIGPGVTVRGADGVLNANSTQGFINQGTIQSDVASEPFVCLYLDNQGMVDALNGSTLTLDGNWSNAGTIAMTNSTVNLDGNFTVTGLGAFNRTGGTVNLSGTLNLTSEVLTLDAASGSWNLVNGTVIGGTIVTADGANLTPSNSGTFDGVTISGEGITIPSTRSIVSHNGLTIDSGATLDLGDGATGHSYLYLSGTQTIDGDGELLMNPSPGGWSRYLSLQTNGTMVTIGPGVTVRGADGVLNANSTQGFINQGTIRSDVASEPFVCLYLDNQGMVDALNGSTLTLDGNWSNSGTIAMTNSTVNLDGNFTVTGLGTFDRTGGNVNLSGTLNLTSEVLTLDAASGSWNLVNGTVIGGTIVTADGANLTPSSSGTFDGVTLSGEGITIPSTRSIVSHNGLTIDSGATLDLGDGATGHSYLYLSGSQTIDGDGELLMNPSPGGWSRYLSLQTNGTMVTIGPGVTLRGADGVLNANSTQGFINQGTIRSDVASEPFTAVELENQGTLEAANGGNLTLNGSWANSGTVVVGSGSLLTRNGTYTQTAGTTQLDGGTLTTTGTLFLAGGDLTGTGAINGAVENDAEIAPGPSPGDLSISGTYTQTASALLRLDVAGTTVGQFDRLLVSGAVTLDGDVLAAFTFTPLVGDSFVFVTHTGITGAFASSSATGLGAMQDVTVNYPAGQAELEVVSSP